MPPPDTIRTQSLPPGLNLYTLRNEMKARPLQTLREVKDAGYFDSGNILWYAYNIKADSDLN